MKFSFRGSKTICRKKFVREEENFRFRFREKEIFSFRRRTDRSDNLFSFARYFTVGLRKMFKIGNFSVRLSVEPNFAVSLFVRTARAEQSLDESHVRFVEEKTA